MTLVPLGTIFMFVVYGHGSVLLWHLCNTGILHTTNFVDDIVFSHNAPYSTPPVFLISERITLKPKLLHQFQPNFAHW